MRFQDAAPDARHVVYAGIQADPLVARAATLLADASPAQRLLARAVMNGERREPDVWMRMFPELFGGRGRDATSAEAASGVHGDGGQDEARVRSEAILAAALEVAERGEQVRSQFRGAIVESLTAELLARRSGAVRRERRILFDGVPAEIHPYDVTVEAPTAAEAYDCKWGARGIGSDVLHQLDDARGHAFDEETRLVTALVVFDARRSCLVRLARQTAPIVAVGLASLEDLDDLAHGVAQPVGELDLDTVLPASPWT